MVTDVPTNVSVVLTVTTSRHIGIGKQFTAELVHYLIWSLLIYVIT